MRTFLSNAINVFMPLRAMQVLKSFLLNVAHISRFARQTCFMIRSRKERHFVHHAMVQTLFSFCQCLFFHLSLSLSLFTLFNIETLLSPFNQFYLCFLRNIPFCTFSFFRRLKTIFFKQPYPCSLQKT